MTEINAQIPLAAVGQQANTQQTMQHVQEMKNAQQQNQMNQYKLQEAFKQQQQERQFQELAQKHDINTPEGMDAFANDAFKINPSAGIDFKAKAGDMRIKHWEDYQNQQTLISGAAGTIKDQVDADVMGGMPLDKAMAKHHDDLMNSVGSLFQNHAIDEQTFKQLSERLKQGPMDYGTLSTIATMSKQGMEHAKLKIEEMKAEEEVRHHKAMEGSDKATLDADTLSDMADQYLAGDKSVLQNLGRGKQGGANLVALRETISAHARAQGKSPREVAATIAEFEGLKAGERTLGTRSANIELAGNEAYKLADLAQKASSEWSRAGIKTWNDLVKFAESKTSSPTLRRFVAANTSFINAYARAINPQGVGTVADKEHAREMLEVGFSKGDYAAAIDQLKSEIEVAQSAPKDVKDKLRKDFTGESDKGEKTPKLGSIPQTNSNGWKLHVDKNGKKAYVSPDGKQFEEAN